MNSNRAIVSFFIFCGIGGALGFFGTWMVDIELKEKEAQKQQVPMSNPICAVMFEKMSDRVKKGHLKMCYIEYLEQHGKLPARAHGIALADLVDKCLKYECDTDADIETRAVELQTEKAVRKAAELAAKQEQARKLAALEEAEDDDGDSTSPASSAKEVGKDSVNEVSAERLGLSK